MGAQLDVLLLPRAEGWLPGLQGTLLKGDRVACRAASASGPAETEWTATASARLGEAGEAGAPEAAARLAGAPHERIILTRGH